MTCPKTTILSAASPRNGGTAARRDRRPACPIADRGRELAAVGFAKVQPDQTTPLTPGLFWVGILLYFGIPMLGWIATLISMKFYPLDDKKMVEIQSEIARIKAEA